MPTFKWGCKMHYKYREDGNLLDDYKRFNAEQIAEVIDKVKTIEGVKWIFRQVVPFSHSHIEELKAVVVRFGFSFPKFLLSLGQINPHGFLYTRVFLYLLLTNII